MATHRASIAVVSGLVLVLVLAGRWAAANPSKCPPVEKTEHRYVGAAACASQNCHGSAEPRSLSATSLQNEFLIWYQEDRHARAYTNLEGDRGQQIGRRLHIAATEDPRCRACHAPDVAGDATKCSERVDCADTPDCDATKCRIRVRDGVTCEACHGPASAWLEPHTRRDWDPSCSIGLGMLETNRPEEAVKACLDCHIGSEKRTIQRVDHDLLAAGHPPLAFEIDSFATVMPAHWARSAGNEGWFDGHAWAAGQVAAVQRAALLFVDQVGKPGWPDFAAYDCQSCHHEVSSGPWARRDSNGRPKLDGARRPGMKALVEVVAKEHGPAMRDDTEEMAKAATPGHGGADVRDAVGRVEKTTAALLGTVPSAELGDRRLRLLMQKIVDLADETSGLGFRAAQQSAWALESLVDARSELLGDKERKTYPEVRAAIGRVYDGLGNPNRYDPVRTERSIRAVGTALAAK